MRDEKQIVENAAWLLFYTAALAGAADSDIQSDAGHVRRAELIADHAVGAAWPHIRILAINLGWMQ